MIKSCRDKDTERFIEGEFVAKFQAIQKAAEKSLAKLNAVTSLNDFTPGDRLEKLKGERAGQWSIRVNDQYRVCFEWKDGDAYEVELVDYH